MNRKEALILVSYVAERWLAAGALPPTEETLALRLEVWVDALGDFDAELVRKVLAESTERFPPNVGEIRRLVEIKLGVAPTLPDWDEFWTWIRAEAGRASLYLLDDHPEFVCPWPALDGLVTVRDVCQWAKDELTNHDLEMVLQAHLRRTFEAKSKRITTEARTLPPISAPRTEVLDAVSNLAGQIGHRAELES